MRSEVREALAAADLEAAEAERKAVLAKAEAEQTADREAVEGGRRLSGFVGVGCFGLGTVFSVIGVAALAGKGDVGLGFIVLLLSIPVNAVATAGAWRAMWRGVDD